MKPPRFLIDECLSEVLVEFAAGIGHEAHHVRRVTGRGASDQDVMNAALELGAMLVTANAWDFRPLYARLLDHPGLVLLPSGSSVSDQSRYLSLVSRQCALGSSNARMLLQVTRDGRLRATGWSSSTR